MCVCVMVSKRTQEELVIEAHRTPRDKLTISNYVDGVS